MWDKLRVANGGGFQTHVWALRKKKDHGLIDYIAGQGELKQQ